MGKAITDFGMQIGQGLLGGAMGQIFGVMNDKRQLKQQGKLQELEMKGQREMTEFNYAKQLQMWKDTNYKAQMEQLEMAGLNPGLIYGMSGGGGATTNVETGKVTGGHAPTGGGEAVAMANSAMQLGLLRAQKDNIEADTAKKKVETEKTGGVDTDIAKQEIINKDAQEKLTRMQTVWQELQNSIGRQTINDTMQIIENTVNKQEQEIKSMKLQNQLNESQMNDKIKLMKYEAIGAALENIKTKYETENISKDTRLKIEQVSRIIQQGVQDWKALSIDQQRQNSIDTQIWDNKDDFPNPVKDLINNLLFIPLGGKGVVKPVTGFHKR